MLPLNFQEQQAFHSSLTFWLFKAYIIPLSRNLISKNKDFSRDFHKSKRRRIKMATSKPLPLDSYQDYNSQKFSYENNELKNLLQLTLEEKFKRVFLFKRFFLVVEIFWRANGQEGYFSSPLPTVSLLWTQNGKSRKSPFNSESQDLIF